MGNVGCAHIIVHDRDFGYEIINENALILFSLQEKPGYSNTLVK